MNVTIIGAGPIGSYTAYLLAKSGHKVSVYERKSQIGKPIQCTGLLTKDIEQFEFFNSDSNYIINTFTNLEVNTPKKKIKFQQKEYLICREKFDQHLADLAQKAGAKIYLNHSLINKNGKNLIIRNIRHIRTNKNNKNNKNKQLDKQDQLISSDIVIAADGPLSLTAQCYGFSSKKKIIYQGIQALVTGNFNNKQYQTFFGNVVCPDLFAWIVPESATTARVGLATTKNARFYFNKFIKNHNFKIIKLQAGIIPLYNHKQELVKDNCYLVGDAAGFVKATTLGGLIPGFKQAETLVNCLNNNLVYKKEIKKLKRKLNYHLKLRKILNKFSDQDWDKLIKLMNNEKVQNIFKIYTRENPLPLITKTIIREPRLLYFLKYLI